MQLASSETRPERSGQLRLETRDLSKQYQIPVLERVNLDVRAGELVCLLGPNGCGKTTLLRILAGLERPDAGAVLVDGRPVDLTAPHPYKIGMVFQEPRLLPWKSVLENVARCLKPLGVTGRAARTRAREYLELVGLQGFERYYPSRLSGGMQQRVSIARALAVDPDTLLMDEPFSALDPETRRLMQDELVEIWRTTGKTIVFITHAIDESLRIGTRIVLLSARPAVVRSVRELTGLSDRQALEEELLAELSAEVWRQRELDYRRVAAG
jgi:NitT/TauT family transport system ATP-binding protein